MQPLIDFQWTSNCVFVFVGNELGQITRGIWVFHLDTRGCWVSVSPAVHHCVSPSQIRSSSLMQREHWFRSKSSGRHQPRTRSSASERSRGNVLMSFNQPRVWRGRSVVKIHSWTEGHICHKGTIIKTHPNCTCCSGVGHWPSAENAGLRWEVYVKIEKHSLPLPVKRPCFFTLLCFA